MAQHVQHVHMPPHQYSLRRTSSMGLSHVEEDDAAKAVAAVKARRDQVRARTVLALFSVSLLWCSSLSAADALAGGGVTPGGGQIGYMHHTGFRQLVSLSVRPTRVVNPGGCQIGYMDHTGRRRLNVF
jgi:hypothetical protein